MARLRMETSPEVTIYDESTVFKAASGASASLVEFKDSSGTVVANVAADGAVTTNNLTVSGNLVVSGTTTTINTETIQLADNFILLNSNATGTPSENAGIEVKRGSSTNVSLRWNELTDKWQLTNDGTTYDDIATETYAQSATSTLDAIGDVTITSPVSGDFLKWNGTNWVNDPTGGITAGEAIAMAIVFG